MRNGSYAAGLLSLTLLLTACAGGGRPSAKGKVIPLPPVPPAYPSAVATPIDPQLQAEARSTLASEFSSHDVFVRSHVIEAVAESKDRPQYNLIMQGLKAKQPPVQFAALMAAGDLQLAEAHDDALELAGSNNRHVHVAAIYCLHRLGDTHLSHELEKLSQDLDPNIRADVAVVLGKIGNTTALRVLRPMLMDPKPVVRLQVAEAMWRLGSEEGLKALVGFSVSAFPDDRMVAILAMADPGDQRVREHIRGALVSEYPELSLVAARAMGMVQSDEGYGVALIGAKSDDARQRQLAALAFGAIGRSDAQAVLAPMLKDTDADVRVASAEALLQIGAKRAAVTTTPTE